MEDFPPHVSQLRDEGAYRVLAAAQQIESTGQDVVHFEIGQPGFPTPQWIAQAGIDAITAGMTRYVNPSGTVELKQAIATHFSRTRKVSISPDRVVVGPGAKPGLWFGVNALVQPGDEVLCPDPGFPSYPNMVTAFHAVPVLYDSLVADVAGELARRLTSKTRVVILNSPSNPTGRVYFHHELAEIVAVLASHPRVWVVSDEIYSHLTFEDSDDDDDFPTVPSIASFPEMSDRTLVVDGFSKAFQMTGWRLGFVICEPKLAGRLHLLMTHALGCTASFTQHAGVVALTHPHASQALREARQAYKARRDLVVSRLNAMPGIKCETPKGAFYVFADVSGLGGTAKEWGTKFLVEAHVALLPGTDFGPRGEGFVRISYVAEEEVLKEGLDRMEKLLDQSSCAVS